MIGHAEVEQLAIRDPLTGLYNRRYFDEAVERVVAGWTRATGSGRRPVAAIVFDLDLFGDFNKQHGHQDGDLVLTIDDMDTLIRWRNVFELAAVQLQMGLDRAAANGSRS